MSFITTNFHEILWSGFRGVALTNWFSSIFQLAKFLSSKMAPLLREKKMNQISCGYAHLHIISFITTTFHEILWAVTEKLCWQEKQDWRTDLVKNIIASATRCLGIIKINNGKKAALLSLNTIASNVLYIESEWSISRLLSLKMLHT